MDKIGQGERAKIQHFSRLNQLAFRSCQIISIADGTALGSKTFNWSRNLWIFLLGFLASCLPGVSGLNPPVLTPVSTNSGNTGPTYLGNSLTSTSSLFFITSANLSLSCLSYQPSSSANPSLRVHQHTDAALVIDVILSTLTSVGGLAMKDPLKVFVADKSGFGYVHGTIQNSSGTYSWIQDYSDNTNSPGSIGQVSRSLALENTALIFIWGTTANNFAWRYNIGVNSGTNSAGSSLNVNYSTIILAAFNLQVYRTDFVVVSMSNTPSIPVIKYSDFSVQYVLNRSSGCSAYASVFDNLNPDRMFEIWDNSPITFTPSLVAVDMSNSTALIRYFPDLALPDTIYSNILNFGPYQYVAVITGQGAALDAIEFIYKVNLTKIGWTGLTLSASMLPSSILGVFEDDKLHYFSFIDIDASQDANFHSYYLELDRCNERDAVDPTICLRCIPPFYRDTVDPGNVCLHAPYFPAGKGRNIPLNVLTSCQQAPLCLSCVYNFSQCTLCDISNPWYLAFRDDQQCYTNAEVLTFPGYWGIKVSGGNNGTCARCSQGCIDCAADHDFCVQCDSPTYFRDTVRGVCYNDMNAPVGIGRDVATDLATSCSVTNCSNCSSVHTICKSCRVDQDSFFNSTTGLCYHFTSLMLNYGGNRMTSNIEPCTDVGCADCQYDKTVCVKCNKIANYFKDTAASVCMLASTIGPGSGGSLISGNVEACTLSGCRSCQFDNTICQGCDMSLNLFLDFQAQMCVLKSNIPQGKGPNLVTSHIMSCQDANCLNCPEDYSVCQFCKVSTFYMLSGSGCILADLASPRTGLDKITSRNANCTSTGCLNCKRDITICLGCDETNGYFLEGVGCIYTTGNLRIQLNPSKSQLVDVSFIITAVLTDNSANMNDLLQSLRSNLKIYHKFSQLSTGEQVSIPDSIKLSNAQKWLVLDVKLSAPVTDTKIQLEISTPSVSLLPRIAEAAGTFTVRGFEAITVDLSEYLESVAVADAESQGQVIGGFVNFGGSSTTTATQTAIIAAASVDPTGTLMKFNQILKIINKLYFININYGKRLNAFLAMIGAAPTKPDSDQVNRFWQMSRSSEGKLSRETIELDVFEVFGWQSWAFLATKLMSLIASLCLYFFKIPKILIYCVQFCKKLDTFVLNLFFSDLIWYCIHSLTHAKTLPLITQVGAYCCLFVISFDVYLILTLGMSHEAWIHRIRNFWKSRQFFQNLGGIPATMTDEKEHLFDGHRLAAPKSLADGLEKGKIEHLHQDESANEAKGIDSIPVTSNRAINVPGYHSILDLHKDSHRKKIEKSQQLKHKQAPLFAASMRHIIDKRTVEKEEHAKADSSMLLSVMKSKGKQSPGSARVIGTGPELPRLLLAASNPQRPNPTSLARLSGDSPFNSGPHAISSKDQPIHYRHTRQHLLGESLHLQQLLSAMLRPHEAAYASTLARMHYLLHFARISAYQFAVVGCQYASGLCIVVLLGFEIGKLSLVVYCYVKYKYLKNIICLLMEVSQSIFLTLFLLLALLISPKRFDEPVIDFYQDAGIWIVIASCVAEYLLLITYITVAAYEFIKNRKARSQSKNTESVIKYGEDEDELIKLEGIVINTGEELIRLRRNWKHRFAVSKLAQIVHFSPSKPRHLPASLTKSAKIIPISTECKLMPKDNQQVVTSKELIASSRAIPTKLVPKVSMSVSKHPLKLLKKKVSNESLGVSKDSRRQDSTIKSEYHANFAEIYEKGASQNSMMSLVHSARPTKVRGIQVTDAK